MTDFSKQEEFKYIKLRTGEDIICMIKVQKKENRNKIKVQYPVKILTISGLKKGNVHESIALQQWIQFTNDKEFSIPKDSILTIATMNDEMIGFYTSYLMKFNVQNKFKKATEDFSEFEYKISNYQKDGDEEKDVLMTLMNYLDKPDEKKKMH